MSDKSHQNSVLMARGKKEERKQLKLNENLSLIEGKTKICDSKQRGRD